jgi:hypothetical protein
MAHTVRWKTVQSIGCKWIRGAEEVCTERPRVEYIVVAGGRSRSSKSRFRGKRGR